MRHRVLIADDEANVRRAVRSYLELWGYEVEEAADGETARTRALQSLPAVVIADLKMPGLSGLELVDALQPELPFTSVILLTGYASVETAVEAMKKGAWDYLTKPLEAQRLKPLLEKAIERTQALREIHLLRRRVQSVWGLGNLVGKSSPCRTSTA